VSSYLFYLLVAVPLLVIVGMIVRAIRLTNATISKSGLGGMSSSPAATASAIDHMRSRDIRCPRCGAQAFAMLGKDRRWMCEIDSCRFEFPGPAHVPGEAA
jgi:ribosomal protein L37AE/L43A